MIHNRLQNITKKLFFLLMMVLLGSTSLLRADELTVYDGTVTNNYVPIYGLYADCYVKSEYVIPAADLADMDGGTINYMKFYLSQSTAAALTGVFQVYLAEVDDASISAFYTGYVTVVYQGTVNTTESIMTIEFTEGYEYNGGNLLVGFAETTSGNYNSCSFYGQTVSGASVQGYNCSGPSSISPTQRNFIPKTTFIYEAGSGVTKYQVSAYSNPENAGTITGTGKYNEGSQCTLTATPNDAAYYFVNWTDEAGDEVSTEASYTFTVTREVTFTANFAESPTHVVTLSTNPEESGYIFTGAGTYYENQECTVAVYNDNDYLFLNWTKDGEVVSTSVIYTFTVIEDVSLVANFATYDAVTYYDGNITNFYIPVGLASTNLYCQSQLVMPAEDLTALVGKSIKGMTFFVNDEITNWYDSEFKVYMTEHPTEAIYEFIDMNEATTVYEGALSIRNNELTISFNTPYDYYGGHLLIGINNMTLGTPYFVNFMGVDKRDASIIGTSNNNNFSSFYPAKSDFLPKTKFYFGNDAAPLYNVTAVVNPEDAGYVYGEGQYLEGGTCILEAYANPGYTFQNWTVGGEEVSTFAVYEFNVTADVEAVANFVPALVMTPNPAEMGYRPNNAWMRSYPVTISNNDYMSVTVNSITTDNEYFQINTDIEFPVVVRYQESLDLEIMHSTGDGAVTGNLIVNFGDDQTVMLDMSAIAYEPGEADVWETAVEVNEYPYVGTAAGIYHNYMIPEAAEGANDAVYKITVDQLSTLEVTTGSVESVFAVYPEDFNGVGGPDLENTYSYGMPVVVNNWFTEGFEGGLNDWWTIDVNADGGTWIHSDENHGGYDYTERAHSGTGFAMCYSYIDYDGPYNTNSYMVTPQMYSIEVGSTLTFWADNANDSYPEYFTVCVSTAENPTADDFIEIWSGSAKGRSNSQAKVRHTENTRYDNWRFHAIDLSEFAGQNVWIAFHDVNYDMYEIWIDDVELSGNRGREVAEDGFVVEAGTYYVVVAAAANELPVSINLNDAPAPVEAQLVYPANESINVSAPCSFVWTLGNYTEEIQVLMGTTNPPTDVLVDWTNELVNSAIVEELENNTVYYVQINERNNTATTYGTVTAFVSYLDVPVLTTEHTWYAYEGEDLKVSWNAIENENILSYNVYVNNELAVNTIELEYTLSNVQYNLTTGYDISVAAVYTLGESEKSNDVLFLVTGNGSVAGVVYEQDGETPIANAVVMFVGDDVFGLPVSEQFITNEQGEYLGTLPYGYYLGYANKMGYQQATCSQIIVYYDQTTEGVNFVMKEVYNPVASVTVTPGDEAATVEWSFNDRSFQFNRVYRAFAYSDRGELLADSLYNTTTYVDNTWAELPVGSYKYGVASVYEGNAGGNRDSEEIVIGEATGTNSYVPTYNLYNYSCTNQIYTGEEIGGAGTINSISFMPVTVNEGAESRNIDIYMVNTEKTAFVSTTDWVSVTDADLVFSGTAYWTAGEWATITLDTPFDFDGTNLCVVVNDLTGTWQSSNKYNVFNATAQAIRIYRDEAAYDPADPGIGAVLNVKNCIKLEMRSLAGNESPIVWSEPVDKDMYTTLSLTVTLNSSESPEGAEVTIVNVDENEQALYPVEPVVLDETGIYTWDSFRKGFYTISITKEGYDESFGYYSIYEPTELTINLVESTEMVSGLYVSPTGYAMWDGAKFEIINNSPYTLFESFENGIPEDWTVIDGNNNGYSWTTVRDFPNDWAGCCLDHSVAWYHSGNNAALSGSWINCVGALETNEYLITPRVKIVEGSTLSFWVAACDPSYASDQLGVFVSVDGIDPSDFVEVQTWTLTAKNGAKAGDCGPRGENNTKDIQNWYNYSVDLSEFAGNNAYIAFRHYNSYDWYMMSLDDIDLSMGNNRSYIGYKVNVLSAAGEVVYNAETTENQMQLPVENLVDGETYLCQVANVYSSGTTEYSEYTFVYSACDNFQGVEYAIYTTTEDGNSILWSYPELEEGSKTIVTQGALNGLFSTSETSIVRFSQGNLQYIGSASTPYWKFADNQWDFFADNGQGSSQENVDRDLFGWGTSGYNHGAICYQPWCIDTDPYSYNVYGSYNYNLNEHNGKADWGFNAISNGGNIANLWRTLTYEEWDYVIHYRNTESGCRFAKAEVNSINGVILLPDNWNTETYYLNAVNSEGADYSNNVIDYNTWMDLFEVNGAVFLPAACGRYGSEVGYINYSGCYWSATRSNESSAWSIDFSHGYFNTSYSLGRNYGQTVRLVCDNDGGNTIIGVLLYRDGELLGLCPNTNYYDEEVSEEHDYTIRVVYSDYSMSCEQEVEYKDLFNITATANEGGWVNINGDEVTTVTVFEDSYCTLEAYPYDGYVFDSWTKDGEVVSTDAVYTFVVEGDAEFEANFVDMHNYFIVNPNTYENTMTMTGIVKIDGVALESMYYELGAIGEGADGEEEVRGSAFLEHVNIGINGEIIDGYYLFMTIYGNNDDELTFKLYDHNTSTLVDLMCTNDLAFEANENLGTLPEPYEVNFMNVISVDYTFTPGWNWWSTNIELTAVDGMAMLEEGLGENATQISAQAAFTNYYAGYGWYGSLTTINNESMYRVQMNTETSFTMIGPKADPADHPITMVKGWNHIGYVSSVEMSVNDALVNITAQQGDMVKSQKSYANYYEGYGWYGSLNSIKPGDGLMYKSVNDDAITFTYPVANTREMKANLTGDNNHWVPSVSSYPNNMTVMAVVEMNGVELTSDNYELAAFVNGECRGSIQLIYAEPLDRYVAFLTVSGDEVSNMTFGLFDKATGEECFNTSTGVSYSNDAMLGNPGEPFVVSFNKATNDMTIYPNPVMKGEQVRVMMASGDQKVVVEIVNTLGNVVSVETVTSMSQGITAPDAAGVYTVRIISEGNEVKCQKLVVR